MIKNAYILLFILLLSNVIIVAQAEIKIIDKGVFIRGNDLYVVGESPSVERKVANNVLPTIQPKWSPDGAKILFAKSEKSTSGETQITLYVVDEKGSEVSKIPFITGKINGLIIGGMRFIETIGWLNSTQIFAEGSVNPNVDEVRIFNVDGGNEIQGYTGFSFSMCPNDNLAAYFEPRFGKGDFKLYINDKMSINFTPNGEDYSLRFLNWIQKCSKLVVIEDNSNKSNLLIISDGHIERVLELPLHPILKMQVFGDNLLLSNASSKLLVDIKKLKIYTSNLEEFSEYRKFEERTVIEKSLEAKLIDWYPITHADK